MKRLAWQSGILAAALILVCFIGRIRTQNAYTSYIPVNLQEQGALPQDAAQQSGPGQDGQLQEAGRLSMIPEAEADGDGSAAGAGNMMFEAPVRRNGYVEVRMRPEKPGRVWADLQDASGEIVASRYYHVGPFGTVYDYSSGGFTGDRIVMIALTVYFLAESLLMFLAFRRAKGPRFYAYSTIHLAGFSLFLFLTGIALMVTTLRHLLQPARFAMLDVYRAITTAGFHFMLLTSPLILAFTVAMTVSNIALLRHERRRLQNVLGILASVLMAGGAGLGFYLFSRNMAGSELEYRIMCSGAASGLLWPASRRKGSAAPRSGGSGRTRSCGSAWG